MKRILSVVLIALMLVALLAGCEKEAEVIGGGAESPLPEISDKPQEEDNEMSETEEGGSIVNLPNPSSGDSEISIMPYFGDSAENIELEAKDDSPIKREELSQFGSVEEIIEKLPEDYQSYYDMKNGFEALDGFAEIDSAVAPGSSEYGTTNTQVDGIDEGDILKNDGRYLYISMYDTRAKVSMVKIVDTQNELSVSSQINFSPEENVSSIYLNGDKLVAITSKIVPVINYEKDMIAQDSEPQIDLYMPRYYSYSYENAVKVYDVSDKEKPELVRNISIDGNIYDSRLYGNVAYLISTKSAFKSDPIPLISDTLKSEPEWQAMNLENIYALPGDIQSNTYTTVLSVDLSDSNSKLGSVSLMGANGTMYMSQNNIYLVGYAGWNSYSSNIYKLTVDGTNVQYQTSASVKGSIINQYSMDEYNGTFRIATNYYDDDNKGIKNGVFAFDKNLELIGSVEDLAPGENIYSVRFMGKTCYMVTYERVDPLFAIDLSNPASPTVLDELKIPGFSEYLHPIGDGYLLGIGRNTAETFATDLKGNQISVGTTDLGMKASLFDIRDPENLQEMYVTSLGFVGTNSPIEYNPRVFMGNDDKGLYAFPIQINDTNNARNYWESMKVGTIFIRFGGINGFEVEKFIPNSDIRTTDENYGFDNRVTYIGDRLYIFTGDYIAEYDAQYTRMHATKL